MKSITFTLMFLLGSLSPLVNSHNEEAKAVVERFIKATDEQDAELLATTMHDKAMQYVLFGPRVLTFSKTEYLDQLKAKKVGGQPRAIAWSEIISSANGVVTVKFTASSAVLKFHYQVTLLSIEGNWQITAINTEVERL